MKIKDQIKYWSDIAEKDLAAAESLFKMKHYSWCLFIGHLVLEKMLKAFYVKDKQSIPPKSHDLVKLAKSTSIIFNQEQLEFLDRVNSFQIETRYPDIKQKFYKLCTKRFTEKNFTRLKEIYKWLKSQIQS